MVPRRPKNTSLRIAVRERMKRSDYLFYPGWGKPVSSLRSCSGAAMRRSGRRAGDARPDAGIRSANIQCRGVGSATAWGGSRAAVRRCSAVRPARCWAARSRRAIRRALRRQPEPAAGGGGRDGAEAQQQSGETPRPGGAQAVPAMVCRRIGSASGASRVPIAEGDRPAVGDPNVKSPRPRPAEGS